MSYLRNAARDFAWEAAPQDHNTILRAMLTEVFEAGAKWHMEQPPTDKEVLAALNEMYAVLSPKALPADDLALYGEEWSRAMLNALLAVQAVRKEKVNG